MKMGSKLWDQMKVKVSENKMTKKKKTLETFRVVSIRDFLMKKKNRKSSKYLSKKKNLKKTYQEFL